MKKLVVGGALVVLYFAARLAWNLVTAEPLPDAMPADYAREAAEIDTALAEELAAGGGAPALNWLAEPGNMLFEGDPQSVQGLIESLHAAGARGIWFTGVEKFGDKSVAAAIAVELPEHAAKRAQILRTEADFWQETEPRPDVGQRYVEIGFD